MDLLDSGFKGGDHALADGFPEELTDGCMDGTGEGEGEVKRDVGWVSMRRVGGLQHGLGERDLCWTLEGPGRR